MSPLTPLNVLRASWCCFALGFFAACTIPQAAYRKVDQSAPEFKRAVAVEAEKRQARGESESAAEKAATQAVSRRIVQEQRATLTQQVTPLVDILSALEKPRGCWAYTATTTTRHDGKESVKVERYDPFQPEARLWTLVSLDGKIPDDAEQTRYRERRLRAWKKSLARADSRRTKSEQVKRRALLADLHVEQSTTEATSQTTYSLSRERMTMPLLGDIPPSRETYLTKDNTLARQTLNYLGSASLLAGAFKFEHFDSQAEYVVIDPELPPFTSRTAAHFRASFFGNDTGEMERETVYSDYRRVKCYEDRFETRIGAPTMSDVIPD